MPKTRSLGIRGDRFTPVFKAALEFPRDPPSAAARNFFESHFRPFRILSDGFVTGYFEPEVTASPVRTGRYGVPLHARPPELIEVDDDTRPPGWDSDIRFAGCVDGRIFPFADRAAIENGYLDGRGLELAWLADPVDAYFIHVQRTARLAMTDGSVRRVAFAGKSGHSYTSIGRLAAERGILSAEAGDKTGLEAWLKANRIAGRALMRENRSYIFFREITDLAATDGPLGAAKVPLSPLRSLAVDRELMTFHTPIWVDAPGLAGSAGLDLPLRRLMVAQDTGSAIVGPARGDIFFGSGDSAGRRAGTVRHAASMVALLPGTHSPEPRAG